VFAVIAGTFPRSRKNFPVGGSQTTPYIQIMWGNRMSLGKGEYPVIKKMKFFLIRTRSKEAIIL